MGVRIVKKTKNMTIGAIIFPRNSPSFTQPLFKGIKILEFNNPSIKKTNDIIKAHNLIDSELSIGQNAIIKKTKKNNSPKLLLLVFFCILRVC
tara:strand:+ start:466 stop:744 length:279 start_codon:yes stop_codon:yes gene_type:complete